MKIGGLFSLILSFWLFACIDISYASIQCMDGGCFVPSKWKTLYPISSMMDLNTFLSSIQTLSNQEKIDKIFTKMVDMDVLLALDIDQSIRDGIFPVRKYLFQTINEILPWIQKKKFPKITYDITSGMVLRLQKYQLSCEIKASVINLRSIGSKITEDDFIQLLPFDSSFLYLTDGKWWDPDIWFVWDIYGSQRKFTGYGVYEWPIAKTAKKLWYHVEIINRTSHSSQLSPKKHLTTLLESLKKWKRVTLWADWCTDPRYEDGVVLDVNDSLIKTYGISARNTCATWWEDRSLSWITKTGKKVNWIIWEHAFVLLWYIGNIKTPSHIIVWDTDTGRHIYPTSEWMRKWEMLGYRSVIFSLN